MAFNSTKRHSAKGVDENKTNNKANHQSGQYTLFARRMRFRSSLPNTPESLRTRPPPSSGVGGGADGPTISLSRSRTMLVRNDKSRVEFGPGVTCGCPESTVLMLTCASLGLASEEIHSVETPLTVLWSLTTDRVDDGRAYGRSSEGSAR